LSRFVEIDEVDDELLRFESLSYQMLEYAAGVEATIVGKPDPTFFNSVLDNVQVAASSAGKSAVKMES